MEGHARVRTGRHPILETDRRTLRLPGCPRLLRQAGRPAHRPSNPVHVVPPEGSHGVQVHAVRRRGDVVNPKYPVYVISKGRAKSRMTSRALEQLGVPYSIVVEPQEYDEYAAVIDPAKIKVSSGTIFRAAEDFTDRYENVALSGFQYFMFAVRRVAMPPFYLNTRIYSCILIRNDLPYRWRGRYNEDTDLSLRALKDGWCTVLFNTFLAAKMQTMTMKGGNLTELYQDEGRLRMAESLVEQHPDVTRITERWGRPQHLVDYSGFQKRNRLKLRDGVVVPEGTNDYGMVLQDLIDGKWVTRRTEAEVIPTEEKEETPHETTRYVLPPNGAAFVLQEWKNGEWVTQPNAFDDVPEAE